MYETPIRRIAQWSMTRDAMFINVKMEYDTTKNAQSFQLL